MKNFPRLVLQKIVKAMLFPTTHIKGDWYENKGYKDFTDYLEKQRTNPKQPLHGVLSDVYITQYKVDAYSTEGSQHQLEAVEIKMKDGAEGIPYLTKNLPCKDKHIVAFLGRSEYYQYDLRDLSIEALKTGATVHGFNYSGMYASTGEAKCFEDLVNDGFAVVYKLIKEKGVHPNDIILQGNCLGSAVAEAVARKVHNEFGCTLRQINSNSFKSIKSVIIHQYPFLKRFETLLKKILRYTGWGIKPGKTLKETGPYACYIHRKGDKTIGEEAKMYKKMSSVEDLWHQDYTEKNAMLKQNSEMIEAKDWTKQEWEKHYKESWLPHDKDGKIISGTKYNDPHELHLYQLRTQDQDSKIQTMYDFINTYVASSEAIIAKEQNREDISRKIAQQERTLQARTLQERTLQEMSRTPIKNEIVPFSQQDQEDIENMLTIVSEIDQKVDAAIRSSNKPHQQL